MKLIEADTVGPHDDEDIDGPPTPPRPEHRRVSVSLLFTLFVLVGTVVAVYAVFPPRKHHVMHEALQRHRAGELTLLEPSPVELRAWSTGVIGRDAPWPEAGADMRVLGAVDFDVLRHEVALVRYEIAGDAVSMAIMRARDTPPRTHRMEEDDDYVVSWRNGPWTCVGVGPRATRDHWSARLGAP